MLTVFLREFRTVAGKLFFPEPPYFARRMMRNAFGDRFRLIAQANACNPMIFSATRERLSISISASSRSRAGFVDAMTALTILRWIVAASLLLMLASPASAQTPARPVRPEFRTTPRPLVTQTVDRNRVVPTTGGVDPEAAAAQDLGARDVLAPMEHIQMVLQRPGERQAAFDAQVQALHQRGSASYHQWLTPETIGVELGPSAADLASAVAIDASHNAWFAVQKGVARVTPAGVVGSFSCCAGPAGVAADLSGNVWVADYIASAVIELSPVGTVLHQATLSGGNGGPQGIAIDGAGSVWAANYYGNSVAELSGSTAAVTSPALGYGFDAPLNEPYGLAIDSSGNLWLSNSGGNTLTQLIGIANPVKTPLLGPAVQP